MSLRRCLREPIVEIEVAAQRVRDVCKQYDCVNTTCVNTYCVWRHYRRTTDRTQTAR
jgi:hypothetical protein